MNGNAHSASSVVLNGIIVIPSLPQCEVTPFTVFHRSLLDEPQFQQSLVESDTEQVPYFTQLRPAPAPALPAQTQPRSAAGCQDPVEMSSAAPAKTYTRNCSTADRPRSECDRESLKELQEETKMKVQESIRRCAVLKQSTLVLQFESAVVHCMAPHCPGPYLMCIFLLCY